MKKIKEFFLDCVKRVADMLQYKLLGMKGMVFVIGTVGLFLGVIPWYGWIITASIVVGLREYKKIKELVLGRSE